MKQFLSMLLAAIMLVAILSGCSGDGDLLSNNGQQTDIQSGIDTPNASGAATTGDDTNTAGGTVASADFSQTDDQMFTDRDRRTSYDASEAIEIKLSGTGASASSGSVQISGSTVRITEEATYILSGTLEDGMLLIDAPDSAKLQLVFNGVHITSATSAALYILEADKVFLTLADGSQNSLVNGGSFVPVDENNIDAALYSKQDLTINGSGQLIVTSPAGHGIVCKDDLVITGGNLQVDAAGHALDANDSIRFTAASLTATAGKDAIHCENKEDTSRGYIYVSGGGLKLQAEGDGISAGYYLHITEGSFNILAGGGSENGSKASSDNWGGFMGGGYGGGRPGMPGTSSSSASGDESSTSMKGLKSQNDMQIDGGSFTINSADDALHSNTSMTVNGGSFEIASGDDALHAEEILTINGGNIQISESYEGLEALHVVVAGGDIQLVASDDGLNAAGGTDSSGTGGRDNMFGGMGGHGGMMSGNSNGSILISGGTLYIHASGDGVDANGTLEITGGHTTVIGPTQGDTATLDYDISATITGGTFIGTGASGMAQTFSGSSQGVIAVSVGSQSAGTLITLTDSSGNIIFSYTPELSYQVAILSCPEMVSGEEYTITVGSQSGTFEAS